MTALDEQITAFHDETAARPDPAASLEVELWDPETRDLVAYGTQMMIFTFPDGPPPPEELVPRDLRGYAA